MKDCGVLIFKFTAVDPLKEPKRGVERIALC